MTAYKQLIRDSQYFVDTPVILPTDDDDLFEPTEDDIVPDGWGEITVGEACRFVHRLVEPRDRTTARNAIIFAFEIGKINATEALAELESHGCFDDPEQFLCAYIAGIRSLSKGEAI